MASQESICARCHCLQDVSGVGTGGGQPCAQTLAAPDGSSAGLIECSEAAWPAFTATRCTTAPRSSTSGHSAGTCSLAHTSGQTLAPITIPALGASPTAGAFPTPARCSLGQMTASAVRPIHVLLYCGDFGTRKTAALHGSPGWGISSLCMPKCTLVPKVHVTNTALTFITAGASHRRLKRTSQTCMPRPQSRWTAEKSRLLRVSSELSL